MKIKLDKNKPGESLVIGIIGTKASGKETIANYIAKKYGGKAHSHSEILDDVLAVLNVRNSRSNEIKLVALRKTFGAEVLTGALNKKIRAENAPVTAITGIRFDSEYENIRCYPNNVIIYVEAPIEDRYQRQIKRKQKHDDHNMSFEEFADLEERETEIHIRELGEKADFKIKNNATAAELFTKIDDIMKKII
jgi:dephospho-CoA kinase